MRGRGMVFMLLVAIAVLCGLVAGDLAAQEPAAVADVDAVVKGNNEFALDLYAKLREGAEKKDGNLFFSPASISTALAMTCAGARGDTAAEMKQTLHFTLDDEKLHTAMSKMAQRLVGTKGAVTLSLANALWGQEGYKFLPAFLALNSNCYEAGLKEVDFRGATEEARQTINKWVEDKTNDKIKELLKPGVLDAGTRLVLTNAIYFKGAWKLKFVKKNTRKEKFHLLKRKNVSTDMMKMKDARLKYIKGKGFAALELPYSGEEVSMVIFLPDEVEGLGKLEGSLTGKNVGEWLSKMGKRKVDEVVIPRFKMTRDFSLCETLKEMGMPSAFNPARADFSGMTDDPEGLFIDEVVHKAFVDVNEEGTEAAAATAVIMKPTCAKNPAEPPARLVFRADHPFLFLIKDNSTGAILFMGRVANPK